MQRNLRGYVTRATRLNVQMGLYGEPLASDQVPGVVRHVFCEDAARGMYARWHELISSPTLAGAETRRTAREAVR